MTVHAVVLAAGKGTRMSSDTAKVLHRAAGRPLIDWALDALDAIHDVTVVVGHQREDVVAALPAGVRWVVQEPQNGTGQAARLGVAGLDLGPGDTVVVMPGDMPLVSRGTVAALLAAHAASGAAATVVTATVPDPGGYGRIIRTGEQVAAIVEDRDADDAQLAITEINTSIYAFDGSRLLSGLQHIGADNDQGEEYLTDVIAVLASRGERIDAVAIEPDEALGVNTPEQLAAASRALHRRGEAQPGLVEGSLDAGERGYAARRRHDADRERS